MSDLHQWYAAVDKIQQLLPRLNVDDQQYLKDVLRSLLDELSHLRRERSEVSLQLARIEERFNAHTSHTATYMRETTETLKLMHVGFASLEERVDKIEDRLNWWVWLWGGAVAAGAALIKLGLDWLRGQ